ncbi:hypothetical protein QBZ16_000447 [Prototheca wickerhamii]|uniref:Plastid ribosomal protein L19 n=1 Tax=Prototheca wickerhamii TaxID=3111 RepID=A0AAD9IMT4_PROWI|nr:hypothetical protein QBZ16_000447 [Prototheca wickerhamii]
MQRLCAAALSAVRPALAGSADVLRPSLAAGAARALRTSTGASTSQADLETTPLAREKGQALPPWTPTQLLQKRKTYMKRAGFMLSVLEQEKVEALNKERKIPEFGPGSVVELKLSVPENKRRVTTFKGLCIARTNKALRTTFTLRNFIGPAAVERTFPLYSPHIQEIKVTEQRRVRRAKLFYMRERVPREYRVA